MRIPTRLAGGVAALLALALTAAFVPGSATAGPGTAAAPSVTAAAAPAQGEYTRNQVFGTYDGGKIRGTFVPDRFFVKKKEVFAAGTLNARTVPDGGGAGEETSKQIVIPLKSGDVSAARGGGDCDVLDLVLGPLDLNLLGLRVELNQVVLEISAIPGAGNLLGNLLCAVAGLLDGTGLLQLLRLSNLLNRILGLLATP